MAELPEIIPPARPHQVPRVVEALTTWIKGLP